MRRQPRVLVVDDDLDSLYYVDDLLLELGYYPIKATTADDAAEIISAVYLDALIVDFDMIATASESALEQFVAARDASAVSATRVRIGSAAPKLLKPSLRLTAKQLRTGVRVHSVDAFGNVEKEKRVRR